MVSTGWGFKDARVLQTKLIFPKHPGTLWYADETLPYVYNKKPSGGWIRRLEVNDARTSLPLLRRTTRAVREKLRKEPSARSAPLQLFQSDTPRRSVNAQAGIRRCTFSLQSGPRRPDRVHQVQGKRRNVARVCLIARTYGGVLTVETNYSNQRSQQKVRKNTEPNGCSAAGRVWN